MNKKLLLVASPMVGAIPLVAVSCGTTDKIIDLPDGGKTIKTLADIKEKNLKLNSEYLKDGKVDLTAVPKTAVVVDGGGVNDKAFNQSAWEAAKKLGFELGLYQPTRQNNGKIIHWEEPGAGNNANLADAYKRIIDNDYKYIVLAGFTHMSELLKLVKDVDYAKKIKDKGIIFITIDFNPTIDWTDKGPVQTWFYHNGGHVLPVEFDTKQAAYMAGYALANYNNAKYAGATNKAKRTLGAFGGGDFNSVTDFITGTFYGIIDANKKLEKDNRTTSFSETINLNSGFNLSSDKAQQATQAIEGAQTQYAVAGAVGNKVAETLRSSQNLTERKMFIGVDTNQSLIFPKINTFTSVQKQIGQVVYNILGDLYSVKTVTEGNDAIEQFKGFELGKTNGANTLFGYESSNKPDLNYVTISNAHLLDKEDNGKAQSFIDQAISHFSTNKESIENAYKEFEKSLGENLKLLEKVNAFAKAVNSDATYAAPAPAASAGTGQPA